MENAKRDENRVTGLLGVSYIDGITPVVLWANPVTHALLVDLPGNGTVASVSVVSANGFAGTVTNPASTPAITISTTVTGVLKGNGTAISACSNLSDIAYLTPGVAASTYQPIGSYLTDAPSDGNTYGRKNAVWSAVSAGGTGDVVGPGSSTTDDIVTFLDGTGKNIKDSGHKLSDYATTGSVPVKATGAELDTGTDDAKFATAKAIKDSHNVPSVVPSTSGNVLTSNGTDWTSATPTAYTDTKVKASGVDTTAGYLSDKLVQGTGISLTYSGAGDETVTVAATGGVGNAGIVYTSPATPLTDNTNVIFTHNLGLIQADVEAGRYQIIITWPGTIAGQISTRTTPLMYALSYWDSGVPTSQNDSYWQANTVNIKFEASGSGVAGDGHATIMQLW